MEATQSLRYNPNLQELVQTCQSRHPDDEELDVYLQVAPENERRAAAAAEVRDVEGPIVRKVVKRIFDVYPYEQSHDLAVTKATRDVRAVVIYASLSMLMNDSEWFKNKLLIWMSRILSSFRFPDKQPHKNYIFQHDQDAMKRIQNLKSQQRSTFETYFMVKEEMQKSLSPESYEEMEPYFQLAIDILSND